MIDDSLFLGVIGVAAAAAFFVFVLPNPVRGVYVVMFTSAILVTAELPIVRDKLTITEPIMVIIWAAMAAAWVSRRRQAHSLLPRQRSAIAAVVVLSLLAVASLVMHAGAPGETGGSPVIEVLAYVYGACVFTTVVLLVDDWKKLQRCLYAWLLGVGLIAVVGVWSILFTPPDWAYAEYSGSISSTMKYENQIPAHALPMLCLAFVLAGLRSTPPLHRLAYMALVGSVTLTIVFTGSRTGSTLLIVCVLGLTLIGFRMARNEFLLKDHYRGLMAVLVVGLGIFAYLVFATERNYTGIRSVPAYKRPIVMTRDWLSGKRPLDTKRSNQLQGTWESFANDPVFGIGPLRFHLSAGTTDRGHNTYAVVLIELGIPALLALLAWLGLTWRCGWDAFRQSRDPQRRIIIASLLLGFVVLLAYQMSMFGLRQRTLWLFAGLLVALPRVIASATRAVEPSDHTDPALAHDQPDPHEVPRS
jgi:O-antigen ligase